MVNNLIKLVIVLVLAVLGYKYFISDSDEAVETIAEPVVANYSYYECRDINSVVTTIFATDKELEDVISVGKVNIVYKDGADLPDPNELINFSINDECHYVTRLDIPTEAT